MSNGKSSISQASSYEEMGEFWDTHSADEHWEQTRPAELAFEIQSEKVYFPIAKSLSEKLATVAREQGVSTETLLNLWVQESLTEAAKRPV